MRNQAVANMPLPWGGLGKGDSRCQGLGPPTAALTLTTASFHPGLDASPGRANRAGSCLPPNPFPFLLEACICRLHEADCP